MGTSGSLPLEFPMGNYEYWVMPFGLVNAPSILQGFMTGLHCFVLVYIDDIFMYVPNLTEYYQHV